MFCVSSGSPKHVNRGSVFGKKLATPAPQPCLSEHFDCSFNYWYFVVVRVKIDSDVESLGSSVSTPQVLLGPHSCLFCHDSFDGIEYNVTHMSRKHGFFIPELAYLVDLEGLLAYLGKLR